MMHIQKLLATCLLAATAAGCAAPEGSQPVFDRPEATTGSNIPRKPKAPQAVAPRDGAVAQAAASNAR